MAGRPRIDAARRRAASAKRVVAWAAGATFVVVLLLARGSHPGHASAATGTAGSTSSRSTAVQSQRGFDFGSADVAPSGGAAPQAQTNVS